MIERQDNVTTDDSYLHGVPKSPPVERSVQRWTRVARLLPGGIRERLFLLIALAVLPAIVLQGWIYYQRHASRRSQTMHMQLELAQGVATTFSAYIHGVRGQLEVAGEAILTFSPCTEAKVERVLTSMAERYPAIRSVNWVSPGGVILMSNLPEGSGRDLSGRPYIRRIMAGRAWAIGDLTPQEAILADPTVAMGVAVRDDSGELRGLVVASFEPSRLGELAFVQSRQAEDTWSIFDGQGRLVYRNPEVPLTWEQRARSQQTDPILRGALQGRAGMGEITSAIEGDRRFAARVPIGDFGWVAGASRPVRIAMAPVWRGLLQDAGLGLLVTFLAFLLAYVLALTIVRPLHRLERDARAMGEGSVEVSVDPESPREVRSLRDTVGRMAADLIDRAEALRESEERYRTLFTNMSEGFAVGEAVFHQDGAARDFRFLDINDAFEQQTGLTREILGRPMTEALPNLEQFWIDTYCGVARTGESVRFVNYNQDTGRHYDVFCYRPAANRFAILFRDVTERVRAEQALREANERLQEQTEELQVQSEELQTQAEELRATNEALNCREREYRTLAENTPEVIARFDRRLRHTYINEYGARVYGVTQRAAIGKTNADLGMPADKVAFWKERFEQVLTAGRQQTVDFEFDSPTFGHQCFSSLFVPEFDARGEIASILAITRDVTERKRVEEELHSVALFPQQNPEPVLRIARDGALLYANQVSARLLESWGTAVGRTVPREIHEHVRHALDSGKIGETDVRCDSVTYSFTIAPVGSQDYANLYGRDVTERKRAEQALRESEERFRTLADAMPQLVWTADPDGRVDYYNERRREFRGIESAADGSFHWTPVLHDDDVARTVEVWWHAVETGEGYQIEHRVQRADGNYHWYLSRGTPVRDRDGRIVKWFGTATDIDDLKRAQEQLRELTATLESRVAERTWQLEHRARQLQKLTLELSQAEDRERKRLAEILHDDLQQQLAAAKFHVGLMASRVRSDGSLQRAADQVGDMLMHAIQTSRSLSHELSPAMLYHGDLGETFEWLAGQIQTKHGLIVHVHADGETNPRSDALKAFLYKAAQEMLFNVVKHARVTEAVLRIRRAGGYLCLVVSDRGRGFNPQELKAAAGFGLFSIRERVELLGGRMKIKSARGKGSTFFIAVPEDPVGEEKEQAGGFRPEAADASLASSLQPPASRDRLRVLVADDHEVVRQGLAAMLCEQPDMEVVGEAANGREAVDLAHKLQPDVVILDVAMPLMNGDEAARQIRKHLPRTRIIALSMHEEAATLERMQRAGVQTYLLKTSPSEELLAAIRIAD